MAKRNQLIATIAGTAVVGVAAYIGYRLFKELDRLDLDDIIWENIDDIYHYRYPKDYEGPSGNDGSAKS